MLRARAGGGQRGHSRRNKSSENVEEQKKTTKNAFLFKLRSKLFSIAIMYNYFKRTRVEPKRMHARRERVDSIRQLETCRSSRRIPRASSSLGRIFAHRRTHRGKRERERERGEKKRKEKKKREKGGSGGASGTYNYTHIVSRTLQIAI